MYYVVTSNKQFEQAASDLEAAVIGNGFGVLHVHNLGETLRNKGQTFSEDCKIFEVCNPVQAAKVLAVDMRLNMVLPCRISVYTEQGQTYIGLLRPVDMLAALSDNVELRGIAQEVEDKIIAMVESAK